jgi:hypothetical protein
MKQFSSNHPGNIDSMGAPGAHKSENQDEDISLLHIEMPINEYVSFMINQHSEWFGRPRVEVGGALWGAEVPLIKR